MDTVSIRPPSAAAARRALQDAGDPGDQPGGQASDAAGAQPRDTALDVLGARLASSPWALTLAARLLAAGDVSAATLANALNNPPAQTLLSGPAEGPADAQLLATLDRLSRHHAAAVPALLALSALGGAVRTADLDVLTPPGDSALEQQAGSFVADAAHWSVLISGDGELALVPAVAEALGRLRTADAATAAWSSAADLIRAATGDSSDRVVLDLYGPLAANLLVAAPASSASVETRAALQAVVARWSDPVTMPAPVEDPAAHQTAGIGVATDAPPAIDVAPETVLIEALAVPALHAPPAAGPTANTTEIQAATTGREAPDASVAEAGSELQELRTRGLDAVRRGDHFDGARHFEELVARCDAAYGPTDVRSLSARTDLAGALTAGGGHHRAHQLLVRVLEETRATNGEEHPATLAAMHNLANNHADLGRHREALALRQSVFDGRRSTLGADHPQTVAALANLANSLALLGRAEEARQARERVADLRESALGADHAQTLGSLNNLANSYAEVGRHGDALDLRQRVLASRERQLGPDHPHTITARNNLANSLMALGHHAEALQQRERTLLDCERVLGVDHPLTITARANLTFSAPPAPGGNPDPISDSTLDFAPVPITDAASTASWRSGDATLPIAPPPSGMWSDPSAGQPTGNTAGVSPDQPGRTASGAFARMAPPPSVPVAGGTPGAGAGVPWSPPPADAASAQGPADAPPAARIEAPPRKRRFWFFLFRR